MNKKLLSTIEIISAIFFVVLISCTLILTRKNDDRVVENNEEEIIEDVKEMEEVEKLDIPDDWETYVDEEYGISIRYPIEMENVIKNNLSFSIRTIDSLQRKFEQYMIEGQCKDLGCFGITNNDDWIKQFEILEKVVSCDFSEELQHQIINDFSLFFTAIHPLTNRVEIIYNKNLNSCGMRLVGYDGFDAHISNYYHKSYFLVENKIIDLDFELFNAPFQESVEVLKSMGYVKGNRGWQCDAEDEYVCYDKQLDFMENDNDCQGEVFDKIIEKYDLIAKSIKVIDNQEVSNTSLNKEIQEISVEESGLSFDYCELFFERENDWHYIGDDFLHESKCYEEQNEFLEQQKQNSDNIDHSFPISDDFYYRIQSSFVECEVDMIGCKIYQLEKGTIKNAEKLEEELEIYSDEVMLWRENANVTKKIRPEHQKTLEEIYSDNMSATEIIYTLRGEEVVETPNHGTYFVNGKIAWEFDNKHQGGKTDNSTIIYDGKDLRKEFNIDAAYHLNSIDGKLVFIGEKDNQYFIVYDGKKVDFDLGEINLGFCCSNIPPQWVGDNLTFRAKKDGKAYSVIIHKE
ncbi:hypothetical protein D4R87_02395 [bacterium]|nr:MAG: hypothetical protein D4R87_02395 [bacterium]